MDPTAITAPLWAIIFWGLITFSLIVVVHEAGHFLTARLFGVKVHEFVIGLPGPMLRWRTKWTTFGFSAVPLGGYVKIAGMEPGEEDPLLASALVLLVDRGTADATMLAQELSIGIGRAHDLLTTLEDWGAASATDPDKTAYAPTMERKPGEDDGSLHQRALSITFRGQSTWKRVVILGTGVLLNLLFAILTFSVVLSVWGYQDLSTTIDIAFDGDPAAEAGVRSGDRILEIEGETIDQWGQVLDAIVASEPGDSFDIVVDRQGERLAFTAILGSRDGGPWLGIQSRLVSVRVPFFEAVGQSLVWTGMVFEALGNLFRPDRFAQTIEQARGVVGVSVEAAQAAQAGPIQYAWLLALLSLSLGALNIFPIPPLDGGKIVLEIVGRVRGKPVGRNVYLAMTAIGALLIFSLVGYLVYADILRYVLAS